MEKYFAGMELQPVVKQITREKIRRYAEASGDFNPIHLDDDFAKKTPYGGVIAHGLMTLAFLSEMMGKNFHRGWLEGGFLKIRFTAPVKPGDEVTARGVVRELVEKEGKKIVCCEAWCENQRGEKVISGEAGAAIY